MSGSYSEGTLKLHMPVIFVWTDTPIFATCTGKAEIKYIGKFNTTDEVENEMMSVRWRLFKFQPADTKI